MVPRCGNRAAISNQPPKGNPYSRILLFFYSVLTFNTHTTQIHGHIPFYFFSLLLLVLLLSMPVVVPFFLSVCRFTFPLFYLKLSLHVRISSVPTAATTATAASQCGTDLLQHPNIRRRRRSIHFSMNKCFSCCFMSLLHFFLIFHNIRVHRMDYNVPNATNACELAIE